LPLEGFDETLDQVDIAQQDGIQLVTSLDDILEQKIGLGYLLQFLISKNQEALIRFWLDVTSFIEVSRYQKSYATDQDGSSSTDIASPSSESIDSGIQESQFSETSSKSMNLSSKTEDAVQIYQRYVAPDSPYPIDLSLSQKQDIVRGICTEEGLIDDGCFDAALQHVHQTLELVYFPQYLHSAFYAKHQLEAFTSNGGSGITMKGILHNEVLFFHFMEFLENEGRSERALVEFWMNANNFKLSANEETRSADSMLIYDKFVSLQATTPLGFNSGIRSRIEEKICSSDGLVQSNCFDEAMNTIEAFLHIRYLSKFLGSSIFSKYLSELMTIIEKSGVTNNNATQQSNIRQRSHSGSSMTTTCSSETLSSAQTFSISARNTLLASSSRKQRRSKSPDFLDISSEPDYLWKRQQNMITNIGHMDHLGRYISSFDLPPDVSKRQVLSNSTPNMKSKISKAVKRIMTNEDMERFKEEMAWQMAEMVVTDVIERSKITSICDEEALSSLGLPSAPTKLPSVASAATSAFSPRKP